MCVSVWVGRWVHACQCVSGCICVSVWVGRWVHACQCVSGCICVSVCGLVGGYMSVSV